MGRVLKRNGKKGRKVECEWREEGKGSSKEKWKRKGKKERMERWDGRRSQSV